MDSLSDLKLAVIVPHQDDELNIAGQILPYFVEAGAQVKICFSTNGDMRVNEGVRRYREAVKAAAVMGLGEEDLVWLGYPDCKTSAHLYHDRFLDEEHPERMETKCYGPRQTLTMELTGKEKPVCRQSLLVDIGLFLDCYKPDVIIAIDLDSHPDHRAVSLLTEEAVSIAVRENRGYKPYVLKKFAYAGCWYGPDDYYSFSETQNDGDGCSGFKTCNPSLAWSDRVRYAAHPSTITPRLRDNIVYMASKAYKTQVPWPNMARVCNSDAVYWPLRTDNLLYDAHVETSSGDMSGLFDLRSHDVRDLAAPLDARNLVGIGWSPEKNDSNPAIVASFDTPRKLSCIEVEAAITNGVSLGLEILIDGEQYYQLDLPPGASESVQLGEDSVARQVVMRVFTGSLGEICITAFRLFEGSADSLPLPRSKERFVFSNDSKREGIIARFSRRVYFASLKRCKSIRRELTKRKRKRKWNDKGL